MALGEGVIAAGIGCVGGIGVAAVEAALAAALAAHGFSRSDLGALATGERKAGEPGILGAAAKLGLPLLAFSEDTLRASDAALLTRSARSLAATGIASLSEAAALAAAGPGARLLGARLALGSVTCALAVSGPST